MKKYAGLMILAILGIASCTKPTVSNVSINTQTNAVNSQLNSNNSTNSLPNTNTVTQTNSEVNADMLKQIEAQQLETADPRKAANKSKSNQPPPPKTGSSQRQDW